MLIARAMTAPPWILLRLGIETSSHHVAADEDRLAAMNVTSMDEYRALLLRIFGFESSVEAVALRMKDIEPSFIEDRLRSMFLREDLRTLGVYAADIKSAACGATVCIDSAAHALGWLFVLERQVLLSGLIGRELQRVLGRDIACSYWNAYGNTPGAHFRSFVDGLARHARQFLTKHIVSGAIDAFRAQRQWYATARSTSPHLSVAV